MPSKYENPKVNTEGKLGAKKLPEQIKGKAKEVNKKSAKSLLGLRIGLGLKNLFSKKDKDIPVAIPKVKGIDRPGQSILKDGSVQFADGSIKHPDGSTDFPDGRKELWDGTTVFPDGTTAVKAILKQRAPVAGDAVWVMSAGAPIEVQVHSK